MRWLVAPLVVLAAAGCAAFEGGRITDAQGIIVTAQVEGNLGGCNVFFSNKGAP